MPLVDCGDVQVKQELTLGRDFRLFVNVGGKRGWVQEKGYITRRGECAEKLEGWVRQPPLILETP